MTFTILEELWFGDISDASARTKASASLAAKTARLHGLRPFPVAAQRLLQMTATADYKVSEVAEVIESDPALATRLLRVVNSAASGLQKPCRTVSGAVTLLGQRNLRQAAFSAAIMLSFAGDEEGSREVLEHSAIVAALCRELARPANLPPEEMYTCGLLHDIGKMMLLETGESSYASLLQDTSPEPDTIHIMERERFGFDHAVLAGQMLADWKIPDPIPLVVGWHHSPRQALDQGPATGAMIHLVHLADRLARFLETEPSEDFFEQQGKAADALALAISGAMLQGVWPRLREVARASKRALSGLEAEVSDDLDPQSVRLARSPKRDDLQEAAPAPTDQLCSLCQHPSFGASCPRCQALLCPKHEPAENRLCARCEAEYRNSQHGSKTTRSLALGVFAIVAAVFLLTLALHSSGLGTPTQLAPAAIVSATFAAFGLLAWARWSRRARFVRSRGSHN